MQSAASPLSGYISEVFLQIRVWGVHTELVLLKAGYSMTGFRMAGPKATFQGEAYCVRQPKIF
jgi:hypothetical protein